MTTKLKIPKIRFKEFSWEWEEKRLWNNINFQSWYAFSSTEMSNEKDNYQLIKMSNVYMNELRLDRNPSFWSNINKNYENSLLKKWDSVLTLTWTIWKKDYWYSTQIKEDNKFLLNQRLVRLREIKDISYNNFISKLLLNGRFLYNFFWNSKWGTWNQSNVSIEDLKNMRLNLPSLPEQQRIASFLSSVDEKIEKTKEKKKNLEEYKKWIMQKIFSQEIRFKDENWEEFGEWEEKELWEVLNYEQPTKYIVESTEYDNNFWIPVLTAWKTFILWYTDETFWIFKNDLPVIIFDDFTTTNQFVNFPFKVKSSAMKILKVKDKTLTNIKYIYEAMQFIDFPTWEHKRHWISEYSIQIIFLPSLSEQEKIANFLSGIDEKIEKVSDELEKMEEFKKGLLQGMFV